jgi:hypothetical protein
MTDQPTSEHLDRALQRLQRGEPVAAIMRDTGPAKTALEPLVHTAAQLAALMPVEAPSADEQQADRAAFVAAVRKLQQQPVSPSLSARLNRWIARTGRFRNENRSDKERQTMIILAVKLLVVLGLSLGSTGGALALAEQSLPDSPLYGVKLTLEDLAVRLQTDPAEQATLYLAQAQARVRELLRLAEQGGTPDEALLLRLRERLEWAFAAASDLTDPQLAQWCAQARQTLQSQEQAMASALTTAPAAAREQLQTALTLITQARQQAHTGEQDPAEFRLRRPWESDGNNPGQGGSQGPQPDQPGPGQPGGNPDATPTPLGDANRYGPQPDQPGPGQPGGNPDATPTPTGDANRYGPQADQPGPGQPGGNPDATPTPLGDPVRHGPPTDRPQPTVTPCSDCAYNRDSWMYRYGPQAGQYDPATYQQRWQYRWQTQGTPTPPAEVTPTPGPQPTAPGGGEQYQGSSGGGDQGGGGGDQGGGGGSDQGGGGGDQGGGGGDQGGGGGDQGGGGGSDQGGGGGSDQGGGGGGDQGGGGGDQGGGGGGGKRH